MKKLLQFLSLTLIVSLMSVNAPSPTILQDASLDAPCRKEKKEQCSKSKGDICFTTSGCRKRGSEYSGGGELLPL